jgi:DDE superfamily endonuclease
VLGQDGRAHAKKNILKPWLVNEWCIPPKANAEFVCAMEDVLAVYVLPYDPLHPRVCFDEKSKQLVGEVIQTIPAAPGQPERRDYEYVRNGTANLFIFVEPLGGFRHVNVTSRRTKLDFAQQMKELVDVHYPKAQKITLVMDNLNTHKMSCLYEAFPPEEARRIIDKIEVVHTPKHGSWLNMAECELSVLANQCLNDRIADEAMLRERVAAWEEDRNNRCKTIDWQFTKDDARIKLRRLYPQFHLA